MNRPIPETWHYALWELQLSGWVKLCEYTEEFVAKTRRILDSLQPGIDRRVVEPGEPEP